MRLFLLLLTALPLLAAPPANDNFASRIALTGALVSTGGTNAEATVEPDENVRAGSLTELTSTVWWKWTAPASGWVRVDTDGSEFDTVLQISTGTALNSLSVLAFNDQGPQTIVFDASSITFLATADTAYHIQVGGWSLGDNPEGRIALHISQSAAIAPAQYPATVSFAPAAVDVTSAAVPVTASFTIQSSAGSGVGGVGFGWEESQGDGDYIAPPPSWNAAAPGTVLQQVFVAPRYLAPGAKTVWFKIERNGSDDALIFSGPDGGSGYALPGNVTQSVMVTNTGPVDEDPPTLTAFTLTPLNVNVTTAPATVQVSASLTDAPAGIQRVQVELHAGTSVRPLTAVLTRTAGTVQSGTWTASITVPKSYPSGNYAALVTAADVAQNDHTWGQRGSSVLPGGDVDLDILGGSAYETWAYSQWFQPGDANAGPLDDADGDGNENLLSYAFGLDPHNVRTVTGGTFPLVELTGTGPTRKLRITYTRRKPSTVSGMAFRPQFSSTTSGVWEGGDVTGVQVTSINSTLERVVVEDPVTVSTERKRFARVQVEYFAP